MLSARSEKKHLIVNMSSFFEGCKNDISNAETELKQAKMK